jgi:putative ABC transport system permease protein
MFYLTYLRRELRRRVRQAVFIAVGLAVGIGLVITVTAASTGVKNAQASVLHALYGIGTDVTVTKPPSAASHAMRRSGAFSPGSNAQVVDELVGGNLGLLNQSSIAQIARLHGVSATAGGLTALTDTKLTVPSTSQLGPGGKPPTSALTPITLTVNGVDLTHTNLGPYASGTIGSGHGLTASDANSDVAVVDANYGAAHKLTVGSTITIAHKAFKIIGITRQAQGGGASDVYIPLAQAEAVGMGPYGASLHNQVNVIYVAAASSAGIPALQKEIAKQLPSATVTSSSSLANAVTGSLASTASLANDLGRWLAIAVLVAAFAVASLLTLGAVARRVREFGALKALGWRSRRIVAQVMGESIIVGVLGAVGGVALGFGGAALVDALAPKLSATVAVSPGAQAPQNVTFNSAAGQTHTAAAGFNQTIAVHMTAPVTVTAVMLAVVLALAGALIAGSLGSWRAARLRPAAALSRVE